MDSIVENFFDSIEDGVLIVDHDVRVLCFNRAILRALTLSHCDVGRPLDEVFYKVGVLLGLSDDVRAVLRTGQRVEREIGLNDDRSYMKRIIPYRDEAGDILGAILTFTDVTLVRHLEKRFKFALQTARLSWWDWKLQDDFINVTSGGDCLLGDTCLNLARDREAWMKLVHPDDLNLVSRTLDECLQGRTGEWSCEHRFRTDAGGWLWVHNQGIVTEQAADGRASLMMGTTRDIDSYKRTVIEAQNQQAILTAADEISKVGIWEYDPEANRVLWSDLIRNILEVDANYVLSPENTFRLVHPHDRKRLVEAFEKINDDGTPYDLRLRFITARGRELLCRAAGRARVDQNGKIVRIIGIFQDITELTTLERELEVFFQLSPDFQATLYMDGTFKFWSPSWEKQLGYSAQELSSLRIREIIDEEDRAVFSQHFALAAAGSPVPSFECRVITKKGSEQVCETRESWISWSFSSEPEIATVYVSARCVTAQREANLAMEEARLRSEEANRAKADFLAVMSHELRTPLNPILGFAEVLLEDAQTDEQKEMLQAIRDSANQMLSLVSEILDYSKLDAGKSKVELVPFSLTDFVQSKVHLMSGQIRNKPIELTSSIEWGEVQADSLPVFTGDLGMIQQVSRNLIGNAIKFTKQGRIEFNVSILDLYGADTWVRFEVKDTGIGIAEKDIDKLFNPFTQGQSGMTRDYGGTGLGLAICKGLVELMGGSISVESKEGKGSIFSFTLPLKLSYSRESKVLLGTSDSAPSMPQARKLKGQVLLVEDNASNVYYIRKLVDARGLGFEVVANGESALKLLQERTFDLVFLDLHMSGIGGLETLKRIRSSDEAGIREMPVYILTADAYRQAKVDGEQSGASGVLVKPISPTKIYEVLERHLKKASA